MRRNIIVSIIIPTYNRKALLEQTIISILNQSISRELMEVLVVDDGSTDDTFSMIQLYENQLDIKYIFQEDKGFRVAKARNTGIIYSHGNICVFVDAGIVLGSKAIEEHIKIHELSHNYKAVIGYVFGFDNDNLNENVIDTLYSPKNIDKSAELLRKMRVYDCRGKLYAKHGDSLELWPAPWIIYWTCNVSIKRVALDNGIMFDECYTTWGGEDIDFALQLDSHGVEFCLGRKCNSIHLPHPKKNLWAEDNVEGMKDFSKKLDYMYNKFNKSEILLWKKLRDYRKVNQALLSKFY